MNSNLNSILGVELMCDAQGIEFRVPLKTSPLLQDVMSDIQSAVPSIDQDRYLADDIAKAASLVMSGQLSRTAKLDGYVVGTGDDTR